MTQQTQPSVAEPAGQAPVWEPGVTEDVAQNVPVDAAAQPVAAPAVRIKPKAKLQPHKTGSTTILLAVALAVAVGGLGFAAGRLFTSGSTTTTSGGANGAAPFANASGAPGGGPGGGGFGGSATVTGTVETVGTDSFTVKLANGQTVTISTSASTIYHAQTSGSSSDLTTGKTVLVQTTGGDPVAPGASANTGTQSTRTATDVTITSN